jgi:hypothetical protein
MKDDRLELDLDFSDDEEPTLRICSECTGSGLESFSCSDGYHLLECRWCDDGVMSDEQFFVWRKAKTRVFFHGR